MKAFLHTVSLSMEVPRAIFQGNRGWNQKTKTLEVAGGLPVFVKSWDAMSRAGLALSGRAHGRACPRWAAGLRKGGLAARTCWQPGVGAAWEDVRRGLGTGSSAGMADNSRVR